MNSTECGEQDNGCFEPSFKQELFHDTMYTLAATMDTIVHVPKRISAVKNSRFSCFLPFLKTGVRYNYMLET